MEDKQFPYYEILANILEKGYAIGRLVETPTDMANLIFHEEIHDNGNEIDDEGSPMFTTLFQILKIVLVHIHNHRTGRGLNQMNVLLLVLRNWFQHFTKPTLICLRICMVVIMKIIITLLNNLLQCDFL